MAEKDLGFVELEWTCPSCNMRNPGSATKCKQCGSAMPADTKFDLGAEDKQVTDKDKIAAAQAAPDIYCAYCGTRNASTAKVCKQCGAALAEGTARQAGGVVGAFGGTPAQPLICPSCGSQNQASALKCVKCGAPLGKPVRPEAAAPSAPSCGGRALALIGVAIVAVIAVVAAFVILGNRKSDTIGQVADYGWRRTIAVQALAPVQRQAWRDQLPTSADVTGCEKKVFQVVDQPVEGGREVCGTPYVVDSGNGYGKKKQDCQYEVLADYCSYNTLAWVAAPAIVLEGKDLAPKWPAANLASNQRKNGQTEEYFITFRANDHEYTYSTQNLDEFLRLAQGGPWKLTINGLGQITDVSPE